MDKYFEALGEIETVTYAVSIFVQSVEKVKDALELEHENYYVEWMDNLGYSIETFSGVDGLEINISEIYNGIFSCSEVNNVYSDLYSQGCAKFPSRIKEVIHPDALSEHEFDWRPI